MTPEKPDIHPADGDAGDENDEMMVREMDRLGLLVSVCAQVTDTDLDFLFGEAD